MQRLVALDVDDDGRGEFGGHLGEPVGAAAVVRPGHPRDAAEGLDRARDPLVVGGDDDGARPTTPRAARR